MKLTPHITWQLNADLKLDPVLLRVLLGVRQQGSLKQSVSHTNLSYRHCWGIIKKWESIFNHPLLILERGRGKGAQLTEFAEQLLWADETMQHSIEGSLASVTTEINERLRHYLNNDTPTELKLFASHGMAIQFLYELLRDDTDLELEFETHGSIESLKNLSSGHCQMAGFHLPIEKVNQAIAPQYQHWISSTKHCLLMVASREQGLIIKKDNPYGITSINDLGDTGIKYINRQRSSGTRTLFDQLLKDEGLMGNSINGYENEEFTHVAVAAMIASGAADAGFGIEAAAAQFKLGFVPFLKEAYILAIDRDCGESTIESIKNSLNSDKYRTHVNQLPGYDADMSGEIISFESLVHN
jgi:molybdate transport repressor ModE-like protein